MARWTVDVEGDWGGRTNAYQGITKGLPIIIDTFKQYSITPIFFVSTEIIADNPGLIDALREAGEVASHGHFHIKFKESWRREQDRWLSHQYVGEGAHFRAPWFYYETEDRYSKKEGHVSVLKQAWFKTQIPVDPIFYIHPFDIVCGGNAPNLFCKLLYSRPQHVLDTFKRLCRLYPGESVLGKIA